MSISLAEVVVSSALDSIVYKGKQKIYEKEIQKKIPNHSNIEANQIITTMINGVSPLSGHTVPLNPQKMITLFNNKQSWSPNKVVVHRRKLDVQTKLLQGSGSKFKTIQQQMRQMSLKKNNFIRNRQIINKAPFFSQNKIKRQIKTAQLSSRTKYVQLQQDYLKGNIIDEDQLQKRKQLHQKIVKQKQKKEQEQNYRRKVNYDKKLLIEQLQLSKNQQKISGMTLSCMAPKNQIITYETIHGKVLINRSKKNPKLFQNIINLKFQQKFKQKKQFDHKNEESVFSKSRKRSDSTKTPRDKGITDKQFNNSGFRQLSCIPYMTITNGVCLSQRSIEASVSRARPSNELSREKFIQTIQNNSFRSYSGNNKRNQQINCWNNQKIQKFGNKYQQNLFKNKESKSNLIQTNETFGKSILWRPNTSRQNNRIKINEEAFEQFIK